MTESTWLTCVSALGDMASYVESRTTERKLRLAACGFVRRIWALIRSDRARRLVEVAEAFADNQRSTNALDLAATRVDRTPEARWTAATVVSECSLRAALFTVLPSARRTIGAAHHATLAAAHDASAAAPFDPDRAARWSRNWALYREHVGSPGNDWDPIRAFWDPVWRQASEVNLAACCDLLRDVVGNPFRPVRFDPGWQTWNGGVIQETARIMYDRRRFDDMPVLADMLEEAGCTDDEILGHCRAPTPHTRGCWVVDRLLDLG